MLSSLRSHVACISVASAVIIAGTTPSWASTAIGVTSANLLIRFETSTPGTIDASVPITGTIGGETIVAIDFRPATGQLYGFAGANNVYLIDLVTGIATRVGVATFIPAIAGTAFGFDVNPAVDRIRVVDDADDNCRFNPVNNTPVDSDGDPNNGITPDNDLAYIASDGNVGVNPRVVGSAYDRNDNDASTATTLFGIDSSLNTLVRQGAVDGNGADAAGGGNPNGGLLTTIGGLGVDPTDALGFDIVTQSGGINTAFATMSTNGTSSGLYTINLTTGAATLVGSIGAVPTLVPALAIIPELAGPSPAGTFQFSAATYAVGESGPVAWIVDRVGGSAGIATVRFTTSDDTAVAPSDYTDSDQTLIFPPGATSRIVQIPISEDMSDEIDETVNLALSNPTGGAALGSPAAAVLTILDDDAAVCGDAFVNVDTEHCDDEGCDDGNANNQDDCPDGAGGTCEPAACGDGFIDMQGPAIEECDDGNMVNDDACTNSCQDPTLDSDGDGAPNGVESDSPNSGDANGDSIPDSMQTNVTSLPNAVDGSYLTIVTDSSCPLEAVEAVPLVAPGFKLPFGGLAFQLPGCPTTKVTVFYHNSNTLLSPPFQYVKRGPNPPGAGNDVVYTLSNGAPHNVMFGSGNLGFDAAVGMVMFTLSEGVVGDGTVGDDRIVDPGGPGVPTEVSAPVLSWWAMLAWVLTLLALAGWRLRS